MHNFNKISKIRKSPDKHHMEDQTTPANIQSNTTQLHNSN
jgi:hypothetical protein